jgi:hypothetical protein
VEEASTLAKDRPDVLARLAHIKQYLRYNHLAWLTDREKDKAKKKELTLAAITHLYRTRHTYMDHWQAVAVTMAGKAAKDFDEPTWVLNDKAKKPWTGAPPPTAEETEKDFREGLAYFQLQQVEEKSFSADLVPAKFPVVAPANPPKNAPAAVAAPSSQIYQGAVRYAFYSNGEPIDLEIITGTIAWYRDRPAARYTLKSAEAGEPSIAEDRLKLDGEKHPLSLKVPKPGLYYFDFNDSGAGWRVTVPAGKSCTILLRREKGFSHLGGMQKLFFYVPKGTKQIDYYWRGNPHKVVGPDGKVVEEVKSSGEFVSIPVPDGADGKLWSFSGLTLGHLWFFNLPNEVAASPEALLVPREVATHDGL